jgi:hypothetical protein
MHGKVKEQCTVLIQSELLAFDSSLFVTKFIKKQLSNYNYMFPRSSNVSVVTQHQFRLTSCREILLISSQCELTLIETYISSMSFATCILLVGTTYLPIISMSSFLFIRVLMERSWARYQFQWLHLLQQQSVVLLLLVSDP